MATQKRVRTRFAPSPTGLLHIGGARTALYAWLVAKHFAGDFLLRLEDTDQARYSPEGLKSIFDGLDWLGLKRDEDPVIGGPHAPYIQSERKDMYHAAAKVLINKGHAYRCFCTSERLEFMRKEQQVQHLPPKYDRTCLKLAPEESDKRAAAGEANVIRMRIPDEGAVVCQDIIRGKIEFKMGDLDDTVLMKSDGMPTYHLAMAVDDHEMEISHVIRGEEWLPSLPKHVLLYQFFGWDAPEFAHLSLFLNPGGGKLSKRKGSVSLQSFIKAGYLREALINFMVLLGWNPKSEREFFSLDDLIQLFDLANVNKAGAVFETEKLDWFNGQYIRRKSPEEVLELCRPWLPGDQEDALLLKIVTIEQGRLVKLSDIQTSVVMFTETQVNYDPKLLIWKKMTPPVVVDRLKWLIQHVSEMNEADWTVQAIETSLKEHIAADGLATGEVLWPLRVALSGRQNSPSPFELAWVLGQEKTLSRLQAAQGLIQPLV
ncbi:MAG: glutamate--tRNA ligase [Patescibacteria group bacterium]